ncbi:phage tail tube protein [Leifsonia sp. TF02-11]|uniref:phage tail tube protein n=1 Tax=Leifsonia sp. TF02-11 TaxID=2815212 RepID=UPI001AA0B75B|nr:IPT/TIG domain-containing protein [Leifsonia sp. TF02-11]MBO1739666.1 IPT/TIG domain-containing protein [Leifsonia sp. TF02-11]
MSSQLARRFKVDVSTDGVTWLPFLGIQDLAPKENPTIVSTTDFDTNGFETVEKTVTAASLVAKIRHILNAGNTVSPGQELARVAGQYQFQTAARLYVRWYDRNNGPEAWQMYAIVDWTASKTAAADIEEVTVTFRGDGTVTAITNPVAAGNPAPVITAATPSGVGSGGIVRITGAYFTGTTAAQVKFGANAATAIDVISDSLIEAVLPTAAAGSAPITVATTAGTSAAFAYTRGA